MNAKCVFNSNTSILTFRLYYSTDDNYGISVEHLKSCLDTNNGKFDAIFDQIPINNSNSYAYEIQSRNQNFQTLFRGIKLRHGIDLCKPLHIEPPPMPVEIQKFEAEHFNVQKLREVKPTPFSGSSPFFEG